MTKHHAHTEYFRDGLIVSPSAAELRAARESVSLTQAEAAKLLHVDKRTWQKWEGSERGMHPAFFELFLIKTGA
ncbi:hypothetical protein BGV56_00875 [Burkholderia ubonensis]|uniref:helix-turn-helix domain-containing protein n=1 Tax=Burkholderia ubonensis TaxID=101571 RepID=UPI0008FE3070|nr:helix-turn-helix domain-containing protein [Burkholderia ubonensis]OJB40380.1 hypothetical protein BGV56_00875 [Burkholderia ubonensis]